MSATVHGLYTGLNGRPATGRIIFEVNTTGQVIRDPGGHTVFHGPLDVRLVDGEFTITLPPSDDLDLMPSGFTFTATEELDGVDSTDYRVVEFQALDGHTVELAALVGLEEITEDPTYGTDLNRALALVEAAQAELTAHEADHGNPHVVTKTQVGLPLVDNTPDSAKPVSVAQAAAISGAISALVGGAPGLLDTLNELAAALADDPDFAATMTAALAQKQPLDTDLSLIAALSTTAFGRALLALADQAAARTALGLGSAATQPSSAFDAAGTAAAAVAALVAGAPDALNTLNELATQLAADESTASALTVLLTAIRNLTDSTFADNLDAFTSDAVSTEDFTPVGAWDWTNADVTGLQREGDLAVVAYAGSSGAARPTAAVVVWEGFPTQPDNIADGDLWLAPNGGAFLTGTAAPGAGTGVDGDVYLRTSTSTLYGPKAAGAWPAGVSLIGAAGSNGTNGTNGTNGQGVPVGGTTGQVLAKASATNYDTGWVTPSAGGSSSPDPRHPAGALAANLNRWETVLGSGNVYVSGTAYFVAVYLVAGVTYSNINFRTASGGLVSTTHSWGTLCDSSRNRLAVTADDTAAIAANTNKAWPITGGYTPTVSGFYYVEVMWAASTISILGASGMGVQQESIPPITAGVGASGNTTPPILGSAAGGTLTGTSVVPFVWLT